MTLSISDLVAALSALQRNLEGLFLYLGRVFADLLGLSVLEDRLWGLGLAVALVLVFLLATLVNWFFSGLRGQTAKDGVARLQKQDEKDMRRAQKLRRYHEIEMLKLEHTREKSRLKDEQANAEIEKQALAGIDRVKFSHRIGDFVAALCIALFARKKSDAFLAAHLFRQHQKADSLYRASVIRSANRIQVTSDQLRFHTKDLQHKLIKAESDHSFIDEVIQRADANISRFSEADADEKQVEEIHNRWREVLQRPLFRESFQSFFERNLDQWNRSLGQEELKSAIQSENQQSDGQVPNGQPPSLWDRTRRWLWADFSNALRLFLFLAVPAELMFTYPIFLALSNGDRLAAVAGATVFTFGILSLGQVSGKTILRMRSRKPGSKNEPDVIETEWRPLSVLAAILLVLVASYGIYAGATLRQNAGEVLRISQEIQNLGGEIAQASSDLERLQADTTSTSEQIVTVEARIERLEQNRARLTADREEIVKRTGSPFLSSEGRAALFIFGVFFLGSVASQILRHDPVYEYSQSSRDLIFLTETREQKRLIAENSKLVFESTKQDLGRHIKSLKSEIEASKASDDVNEIRQNALKRLKIVRHQINDYVRARGSSFGAQLAVFGCIESQRVTEAIDEHASRKEGDDPAQVLES